MYDVKWKMDNGRCVMNNERKRMGKITEYMIHITSPILHQFPSSDMNLMRIN
jgi:hypothetical protein